MIISLFKNKTIDFLGTTKGGSKNVRTERAAHEIAIFPPRAVFSLKFRLWDVASSARSRNDDAGLAEVNSRRSDAEIADEGRHSAKL
jgi:hypothetical protein